ncbi:hypothetical protein JTB14_004880 [Gonioctena quinquepunctata]|nr:hypothetical protein JTB14_004880 [Gonioctena quinquepunctata]
MSKDALEQKMVQLEERKIDAIVNMRNTSNKEHDNDDDFHFLMSLLPYMKKLEPLDKLHARTQIQSVVMDVYRRHDENSRVSNNYLYSRPESSQSTSSCCISRSCPSTMSAGNTTPQSYQDVDDVYTILNM